MRGFGGLGKGGGGGGGHHGGGHHHHGGRGRGGFGPGWGGYGYGWDYPTELVVVDDNSVQGMDHYARSMAYIMSLPKSQRAAAYVKIFGQSPPPGALGGVKEWRARARSTSATGDFTVGGITIPTVAIVAVGAAAAYFLFIRKKRPRRRHIRKTTDTPYSRTYG